MSNLISKLPEDIKKVALEYQRDNKIVFNGNSDNLKYAFDWHCSKERYYVWNEVYNSNYQPFYDFHAKKSMIDLKDDFENQTGIKLNLVEPNKQTPEDWCKAKGYNEYFVMIIKQYLEDNG